MQKTRNKAYLSLALLALAHASAFLHGIGHEHSYCFVHQQIEESKHSEHSEHSEHLVLQESTSHAITPNSSYSKDEHDRCIYLACFLDPNLVSSSLEICGIDCATNSASPSFIRHPSNIIVFAPKTSPPLFSAS